jgi:hypothetical protein
MHLASNLGDSKHTVADREGTRRERREEKRRGPSDHKSVAKRRLGMSGPVKSLKCSIADYYWPLESISNSTCRDAAGLKIARLIPCRLSSFRRLSSFVFCTRDQAVYEPAKTLRASDSWQANDGDLHANSGSKFRAFRRVSVLSIGSTS